MDKNQIIFSIYLTSILLIVLIGFLFFVLLWQRKKSNDFIKEREMLQILFNEQLLKSQLEMQEQTFNNISQEIHDNVGQILSLAKVQLNIMGESETLNMNLLTDAKEGITKAMIDLGNMARSMNTERVRLFSLPETVENELKRINRAGFNLASVRIEGCEQSIDEQKKLILFRIIQESLQNIIKHSKATAVNVIFYYSDTDLKIEITDNGKGFEMENLTDKTKGLGLRNIISRASLIGGEASINSIINLGTTVTIKTPYA